MLSWLGSQDVNALIARKNYPKAIRLLEERLADEPRNVPLRQQLGDVLGRAGEAQRAVAVLKPLVHEFASDGFVAKAIAVLKKIQRLDPGESHVAARLADLVKQREADAAASPVPPVQAPEEAAQAAEPAAVTDDTFELDEDWLAEAAEEPPEVQGSPVFKHFTESELAAVIGGLRLSVRKPGAIIFGENEPGDSLFILASGYVRVYQHNEAGCYEQVAVLQEGEFFGESAVLTGNPRSATVTAATECELLELDKSTLQDICSQHPRVRAVLEEFHRSRAGSDVTTTMEVPLEDFEDELDEW